MFQSKGIVVVENNGYDEDKLMEDCVEAGADDYSIEEDSVEFVSAASDLHAVRDALTEMGYTILSAETAQIPDNYVALTDEEAIKKMNLLLEHLEDNDDVQNVWHNWENPEE